MSTPNNKALQVAALVGVVSFIALGAMAAQREFKELSGYGPQINASGPKTRETRSLRDFDRVEAGQIFQVDVSFGSTPAVTIEAPRDLLHHITSEVHNGTLSLGCNVRYSLPSESHIKIHVVTRKLTGAEITGAGHMIINGRIQASKFEATASGAATLTLSANVDKFSLEASGASKTTIDALAANNLNVTASGAASCTINGRVQSSSLQLSGAGNIRGKLTSDRAEVEADGASHAAVHVLTSFKGEATGASSITYSGNPAHISVQSSGVGSVSKSN